MTQNSDSIPPNPRVDPSTGAYVHVVGSRQGRPNLPSTTCPFCVGGLEAPHPYTTRWFPNRWPSLPDDRCEVILYSDDHSARFVTLDIEHLASIIGLWVERSSAHYARSDTSSVLIFENSGRDVGATIDHPHGQLYSFDHVPQRTAQRISANWRPTTTGQLVINEHDGFVTSVASASPYPVAIEIAPVNEVGRLADLNGDARVALAHAMRDALERLTTYFGETPPYMLWVNQRPNGSSHGWLNVEIVSPWRARGVMRYIAAAEVSTGEYFNPLVPEDLAQALRERLASPR
jgi:UDPglucose--hexose-1-phosphate uridylyltransferase